MLLAAIYNVLGETVSYQHRPDQPRAR